MERPFAKKAACNQSSHTTSCGPKLIVVPSGNLQTFSHGQCDQLLSLESVHSKGLLNIDMASPFQARLCNIEMALGWCSDMNNVRLCILQEFGDLLIQTLDREPIG